MHPATHARLEAWWSGRLGVGSDELWRGVTAAPHGALGDYPGLFVAWRGAGLHVSLPAAADLAAAGAEAALAARPVAERQDPAYWQDVAERLGLVVVGPSTHLYLDEPPAAVAVPAGLGVEAVDGPTLADLRDAAGEEDWAEAGFADGPETLFALRDDAGEVLAGAGLLPFAGRPGDVGVLVAPRHRGRGLAAVAARHAASYAVTHHGLARWGARDTNAASQATARRLGFEPYCAHLAVR